MADRQIVYFQEQVDVTDFLQGQQNGYVGLAKFMQQILGSPAFGGFVCTPTPAPSLNVDVGAGEIYSAEPTDITEYGVSPLSIPANPQIILKQGQYNGGTFSTPAPTNPGDIIKYLIQIAFQEIDNVTENRLYETTGLQPTLTRRQDIADVQIKAGTPSPSPLVPTPDIGYAGAWVITVAYGQTSVTGGDIEPYSGAPFFGTSYGDSYQDKVNFTTANNRFTLLPNVGNSGFYCEGTGSQVIVNTTFTNLPITSSNDPFAFINGGVIQPNFSCFMNISCYWDYIPNGGAQQAAFRAIFNDTTVLSLGTLPKGQGGTLSLPMSFNIFFNGTTDYVRFQSLVDAGTAPVSIKFLTALVIAN